MCLVTNFPRFDFTIILPANLAPHDWHPNGTIQHYLYAELEGAPEPERERERSMARVGSSTSLFGFRASSRSRAKNTNGSTNATSSRAPSRAGSRPGSRAPSPGPSSRRPLSVAHTLPPSGAATPSSLGYGYSAPPQALAGALASLNLNPNGTAPMTATPPLPSPGLPPSPNPAYLSAAASMSLTRQETQLPRIPSYENAMATGSSGASTPPEWLQGTTRVDRKVMIIYNPDISGGAMSFDDTTSGFIKGLGVWDLSMMSDIVSKPSEHNELTLQWSISALLSVKIKITSIPDTTTIFAARLLLQQTCSIISPRDPENSTNKLENTRYFSIMEAGKRPPPGHHHPDRHYPAMWRGTGVPGGKDQAVDGSDGGEILIDTKGRLPTDDVGRPSTLPGVVTPINVTHHLVMEVYFSVWSEDDRGEKMKLPGPGGLRMLRVSRPVTIPSCTLMPQIVDLPRYGDHEKDPMAPHTPDILPEDNAGFAWANCACGMKLEDMEKRMKAATVIEAASQGTSLAGVLAAAQAEDKAFAERGRRTNRNGSV